MKRLIIYAIIFSITIALTTFFITRPYILNSNKIFNIFFNNIYRKIDYVEIIGNSLVSTDDIVACLYTTDKNDKFLLKDKESIINSLKNFNTIETVMLKYTLPKLLNIPSRKIQRKRNTQLS